MTLRLARGIILIAWLCAMAWLIRFEAFPETFSHTVAGYKGVMSGDVLLNDQWMRILLNDRPVGYVHSSLDTDDQNAIRHYRLQNRVVAALNIMGERRDIRIDSEVDLDLTRNLNRFAVLLSTGFMDDIGIRGERKKDNTFLLTVTHGTNTTRSMMEIPDEAVIYSPVTTLIARDMAPGDVLNIRTVDPFTRSPSTVSLEAIRHESLTVGSNRVDTLLIHMKQQGLTIETWVAAGGELVRQRLPAGITIEKATPDEATDAYLKADVTTDILPDILQALGKPRP